MSLYPKNSGRTTHDWRRTRSSGGTANLPDSKLCQDRQNVLLLSVVSVWEMQIKRQLGKLRLALPLKEIIETQQQTNSIEIYASTRAGIGTFSSLSHLTVYWGCIHQ